MNTTITERANRVMTAANEEGDQTVIPFATIHNRIIAGTISETAALSALEQYEAKYGIEPAAPLSIDATELTTAQRGNEAVKTCTKPTIEPTATWDDIIDTGIEIHFTCGNFVTIPEAIIRHAQASRDADRCVCPYCGAKAQIIQRVQRLRNDNDNPIVFG